MLRIVWQGRIDLSYETAAILVPFALGLIAGFAFGRRERDLAVPRPAAAAALATGFIGGGLIVAIVLVAGRQIPSGP
jgi:uncharacterized transporter YbjL